MRTSDQDSLAVRRLIADDDLRVIFQPIVDIDASTVVGYEALARGPAGSPLESPGALFAAARAAGASRSSTAPAAHKPSGRPSPPITWHR